MQKECVRAFKNELRNYNYYLSRRTTLKNSIEYCYDRLSGFRGIDPSKEPTHAMPNKDLEYRLREQIETYTAKLKLIEDNIEYIDKILAKMETSLREAVISVYCEGNQTKRVADRFYLSSMGLVKRMNKEIERALE